MSGIAEVLINLGYSVTGSDLQETDITERLRSRGARIFLGHDESFLGDADVVVTSTAISGCNPEVTEAKRRGTPVIPRAEMLAELLKMKFSIAVSGCHGKTTTTSMISTILASGGLDPTMVIGGKLLNIGTNAHLGSGEIIVAEADESDGSFLRLAPLIAVITNIDREHLDYYEGIEDIKDAFIKFANSVPFYGFTIVCKDCGHIKEVLPLIKRRVISYGIETDADYKAHDISFQEMGSRFRLDYGGKMLGEVTLRVPGLFNVYNSMAAIAVAREMGMDFESIKRGIDLFQGVHRRLEIKGVIDDIVIVDDYGHHPTEIKETLQAARQIWKGKITVVFQPHRYTRTQALFKEFLSVFNDADSVILTDIYAASEKEITGIHSEILCKAIKEAGHPDTVYISDFGMIVKRLSEKLNPTDTILTLGAGNVWKIGEELLKTLQQAKERQPLR